mgnify:CR=1 FL=1
MQGNAGSVKGVIVSSAIDRPNYETFLASDLQKLNGSCSYDIVELKADGIWGKMTIWHNKVTVYSRHGKKKAHWFINSKHGFKSMAVIHGEFMYGSSFSKSPEHQGKFYAFDCTVFEGQEIGDMPLLHRRHCLLEVIGGMGEQGRISPLKQWYISDTDLVGLWADKVVEGGWEGLVLKRNEAAFGSGFARIKTEYEVDYVCTGFKQSSAEKYRGCMVRSITGGLYFGGELRPVVNVSGMSEAERLEMFARPENYIGRVFTVRGKGLFKSGAVRHPNYIGLHPEKLPEECTFEAVSKTKPCS